MRLKVSSAKRRPFCLGLNVLINYDSGYWLYSMTAIQLRMSLFSFLPGDTIYTDSIVNLKSKNIFTENELLMYSKTYRIFKGNELHNTISRPVFQTKNIILLVRKTVFE